MIGVNALKAKQIFNKLIVSMNILSISACSITTLPKDTQKSIKEIDTNIDNASLKLNKAKNVQQDNFIKHTKTGYFGNQTIAQSNADVLPSVFNNQVQLDRQFNGLRSIATAITDLTQIPTILDLSTDNNDFCAQTRITQQDGNLIELLNLIGARCDIGWTYRQGQIILSDTETKTWPIRNIPGDIQIQNQINNNTGVQSQTGSQGGGGTSQASGNQSTTQNIAFNLQNSLWQNIQEAVKSMLSKSGRLSVSPSTSSLTVTDKPSVLLRVDRYIKNQNEIMKRQVQIDVQVLNVDVDAADNYGINWTLALQGANAKFMINGQAVNQGSDATTKIIKSNVFVPTTTTQSFTLGVPDNAISDIKGSELIINALSNIAKTSLVTSAAVTTLSNQPVPVQFVDQQSYLASVQNTISGQGGFSQTTLTPGQVTTGFSLNVLPVIQSDNKVLLQLSLNISALKKISQYTSNGSSVQLPETLQRNLMQKAVIRSGDTFVVTGFDSDSQSINNTGVGGPYNWLLGGGVSANKVRTKMVILVTPRIVSI